MKAGFVAIVGRPNVGKSTLLNAIVGEKVAITADKPQTTRNRIRGVFGDDESQIVFIDTPGVTRPRNRLGEYMTSAALASLPDADAILFITDGPNGGATCSDDLTLQKNTDGPNGGATGGDGFILQKIMDAKAPALLVLNKMDLMGPEEFRRAYESWERTGAFEDVLGTIASEGVNVDKVVAALKGFMPEGPRHFPEDMVTDRPERFLAAEFIREKALRYLRDEVPHGVAVEIERYEEKPGITHISAIVYTEKQSHKGIVIGKGGRKLKGIGKSAREDMERLLGTKVFLEIRVKVKAGWRDSDFMLGSLGYKD